LLQKIDVLNIDIQENLQKYKQLMDKLPGGVEAMMNTIQECQADSTPDKLADYFEEREHLTGCLKDLKVIKANLDKIDRTF
jgi:hypothetical protein